MTRAALECASESSPVRFAPMGGRHRRRATVRLDGVAPCRSVEVKLSPAEAAERANICASGAASNARRPRRFSRHRCTRCVVSVPSAIRSRPPTARTEKARRARHVSVEARFVRRPCVNMTRARLFHDPDRPSWPRPRHGARLTFDMRRFLARLLALALALGMLVPSSAIARVLYECRMMGTIGPSCCCAPAETEEPSRDATADVPDCCDATVVTGQHHPASVSDNNGSDVPQAGILAVLPRTYSVERAVGFSVHEPTRARGPPPNGPPIYIQHCALLN